MKTNLNIDELPYANRQIKNIIDKDFNGNVLKFSKYIGLNSSSKINRLFNKDKRSNNYPDVTIDVILLICNAIGCTTDSLLIDKSTKIEKHINNITIDAKKQTIKGNKNIIGDSNKVSDNEKTIEGFMEIIRIQQEQISKLMSK